MSDPNLITPVGLERIRRELDWLQKSERPMVTREVAYAASLGDRSENAEYHYGKKRLRSIDSRMRFLMKALDQVRIVDPSTIQGAQVRFGATVVVEDEEGRQQTWRLYGESEVDIDRGVLSWRSPLARALVGKSEGDSVRFKAPQGMRELEICEVRYEAQEPLPEDWKPRPPPVRG